MAGVATTQPTPPQSRGKRFLMWAFATLFVAFALGQTLTSCAARGRIVHKAGQAKSRSVVIVLGALVHRSGRLSDTVADRVACGAELYQKGKVRRVLVSGDHGTKGYDEVTAMGRALLAAGVKPQHLFLDHAGFRTLDSMQRARRIFGVRDALICTQRFHLPRSIYLARHSGIDAFGVVADRRRYRTEWFNNLREPLARSKAVLEVLFGRDAKLFGPPIPITGDGRVTHDPPFAP